MLIEIDLPDDLFERAAAEAERRGISLSDLATLGLQVQLDEWEKGQPE